jgi:hypothetical protein
LIFGRQLQFVIFDGHSKQTVLRPLADFGALVLRPNADQSGFVRRSFRLSADCLLQEAENHGGDYYLDEDIKQLGVMTFALLRSEYRERSIDCNATEANEPNSRIIADPFA